MAILAQRLKMAVVFVLALALLACFSLVTCAASSSGVSKDEVATLLTNRGLPYTLELGSKDAIRFIFNMSVDKNHSFKIALYLGDLQNGSYQYVLASACFAGSFEPVTANKWNSVHRYGRAYVDDDKDIWLEADLSLAAEDIGTVSRLLDLYQGLLRQFAGEVLQIAIETEPSERGVLFTDDFNRDNIGLAWQVYVDGSSSGSANWHISDGSLWQTSNIYRTDSEYELYEGTHIVTGDAGWRNYELSCTIVSEDNDGIAVLTRYQDKTNFYRFIMLQDSSNNGPFRRLEKIVDDVPVILAEQNAGYESDREYNVRFVVNGVHLEVWLDGEMILSATDSTFDHGAVGFMTYANSGLGINHVKVEAITP